jgi:hypothetical protein
MTAAFQLDTGPLRAALKHAITPAGVPGAAAVAFEPFAGIGFGHELDAIYGYGRAGYTTDYQPPQLGPELGM